MFPLQLSSHYTSFHARIVENERIANFDDAYVRFKNKPEFAYVKKKGDDDRDDQFTIHTNIKETSSMHIAI